MRGSTAVNPHRPASTKAADHADTTTSLASAEASLSLPTGPSRLGAGAHELSAAEPASTAGTAETVASWWIEHSDGSILGTFQAGLEGVHAITGLPWWVTIALTTVAIKAALFPFTVVQAKHAERLGEAWPELPPHAVNETSRKVWSFVKGTRGIVGLHGAHPLGLLAAPLTNIPVFVSFIWATRRMLLSGTVDDLTSGGLLWFQDLSYHDTSGVLPLTAVMCTYVSTEIALANSPTPFMQKVKDFLQSLIILSFPFVVTLPQGVFMYWIPSSLFTGAQLLTMRHPGVRGVFGLKPLATARLPPQGPADADRSSRGNSGGEETNRGTVDNGRTAVGSTNKSTSTTAAVGVSSMSHAQ
ncbi:unnamed protein product [Sphacelaria rigidula]